MLLADDSPAAGQRVGELELPEGSLVVSVCATGRVRPEPDTVLEAGDEVLAVLDPGVEEDLKHFFGPDGDEGDDTNADER